MNAYQYQASQAIEKRINKQSKIKRPHVKSSLTTIFDLMQATAENMETVQDLHKHFSKEIEVPVEIAMRHGLPF